MPGIFIFGADSSSGSCGSSGNNSFASRTWSRGSFIKKNETVRTFCGAQQKKNDALACKRSSKNGLSRLLMVEEQLHCQGGGVCLALFGPQPRLSSRSFPANAAKSNTSHFTFPVLEEHYRRKRDIFPALESETKSPNVHENAVRADGHGLNDMQ